VTALKPEVPCTMARPAGEAESVKPGCGVPEGQLFTRLAALMVPMAGSKVPADVRGRKRGRKKY